MQILIAAWRRAFSDLVRTCLDAGKAGRDAAAPISMQSRVISDENFCAPRKFRKFSNLDQKSMQILIAAWRRASSDLVRTCLDAGKAGRDAAAPISMQSRVILDKESTKKIARHENFENFRSQIDANLACRMAAALRRSCADVFGCF